jgi:molybdopterin molybdotransferase
MKTSENLTLEQAFLRLDEALGDARLPDETTTTLAAGNRVLAASTTSALDLPPFDKAAMDGYALPASEGGDEYRVTGSVVAGQSPPTAPLGPGQAMRVMTGAAVPPDAAEVVMQEDVLVEGSTIRVLRRRGRNICPRGEDVHRGDLVLSAGHRIRPLDVANLVACGVTEVRVVHRPRIAIISTGNELADDPATLRPGQIMNSNGPLLCELSRAHGLDLVAAAHVGDNLEETCCLLEQALGAADLAVLSGGVSVGDLDFVPAAFTKLGLTVHVARMAVKPGRPVMVATRGRQPVFGLPGNPVSVFLMFHLLVLRAVARLTGSPLPMRTFSLPLATAFARRTAERAEFLPARLSEDGRMTLIEYHGSAHLSALATADGFIVVPQGKQVVEAGERVTFWSLGRLES